MFLSSDGGPGLDRDKIHVRNALLHNVFIHIWRTDMQTMFVWASTVNFLSPLLLGVILDWYVNEHACKRKLKAFQKGVVRERPQS
jgi:hypothetical protein